MGSGKEKRVLKGGPGKKTSKGRSVGLGKEGHFFLQRTKKEQKTKNNCDAEGSIKKCLLPFAVT